MAEATKMAKLLMDSKKHIENLCIKLPIIEIDRIHVNCTIGFMYDPILKNETVGFRVEAMDRGLFNLEAVSNEEYLTEIEVVHFIAQILYEILPNLKLKKNGNLELISEIQETLTGIDDIFATLDIPNIETNCGKDCIVCYEKTQTKTKCEHVLCYRCWSKLKKVDGRVPCPFCRKNI